MNIEVLVSNMALWPLSGLPLEYTGLIARSLGFTGVEHVPTKAGKRQIEGEMIGKSASIKSGHWSWRSEPYGKEGQRQAKSVAALITIATMPIAEESEAYLAQLQRMLKTDLPTVLYLEKLSGKHPKDLPFKDISVQITPSWLEEHGIQSLDHLVDYLHDLGVNPCYDTVHSNELTDPIRAYVQVKALEVHIGVDRFDVNETHGDTKDLSDYVNARRFVVESAIPNPVKLFRTARSIKEYLKS